MNATEFRLGNLTQDQQGTLLRVDELCYSSDRESLTVVYYVLDRSKLPLSDGWEAEPIQLTTHLLKRFGFEKTGEYVNTGREIYRIDGLYFDVLCDPSKTLLYLADPDTGRVVTNFHYAHRLQNLYFALTGEELTTNN